MKYTQPTPVIDGWMTDEELQWLFEQAQRMTSIVEVGSWKGRSTHALLSGCPGLVYAVDHWEGSPSERQTTHSEAQHGKVHGQFLTNVGHFPTLRVLQGESTAIAAQFDHRAVDMVFLDGGHDLESIRADLRAWGPVPRVLLCGHDSGQEGVPQALSEYSARTGQAWERRQGTLWSIAVA